MGCVGPVEQELSEMVIYNICEKIKVEIDGLIKYKLALVGNLLQHKQKYQSSYFKDMYSFILKLGNQLCR